MMVTAASLSGGLPTDRGYKSAERPVPGQPRQVFLPDSKWTLTSKNVMRSGIRVPSLIFSRPYSTCQRLINCLILLLGSLLIFPLFFSGFRKLGASTEKITIAGCSASDLARFASVGESQASNSASVWGIEKSFGALENFMVGIKKGGDLLGSRLDSV